MHCDQSRTVALSVVLSVALLPHSQNGDGFLTLAELQTGFEREFGEGLAPHAKESIPALFEQARSDARIHLTLRTLPTCPDARLRPT